MYRCKTGLERPTYRPRFTFGVVVKQGPVYLFYIENCFDKSGFKFSFKGIFCSVGGGGKLCFLAKAMVAFYGHLKGGVVFRHPSELFTVQWNTKVSKGQRSKMHRVSD